MRSSGKTVTRQFIHRLVRESVSPCRSQCSIFATFYNNLDFKKRVCTHSECRCWAVRSTPALLLSPPCSNAKVPTGHSGCKRPCLRVSKDKESWNSFPRLENASLSQKLTMRDVGQPPGPRRALHLLTRPGHGLCLISGSMTSEGTTHLLCHHFRQILSPVTVDYIAGKANYQTSSEVAPLAWKR